MVGHVCRLQQCVRRMNALAEHGRLYSIDVRFKERHSALLRDSDYIMVRLTGSSGYNPFNSAIRYLENNNGQRMNPFTYYLCRQSAIFEVTDNECGYYSIEWLLEARKQFYVRFWFESRDQAIMAKLRYG